jgi:hypothetical protein
MGGGGVNEEEKRGFLFFRNIEINHYRLAVKKLGYFIA